MCSLWLHKSITLEKYSSIQGSQSVERTPPLSSFSISTGECRSIFLFLSCDYHVLVLQTICDSILSGVAIFLYVEHFSFLLLGCSGSVYTSKIECIFLIHRPLVTFKSLPHINHNSCISVGSFILFALGNFDICALSTCSPSWRLPLDFMLQLWFIRSFSLATLYHRAMPGRELLPLNLK